MSIYNKKTKDATWWVTLNSQDFYFTCILGPLAKSSELMCYNYDEKGMLNRRSSGSEPEGCISC